MIHKYTTHQLSSWWVLRHRRSAAAIQQAKLEPMRTVSALKIQYSVAHCDVLSGGYNTMLINTVFGGYANLRATALLRTKHVQTD